MQFSVECVLRTQYAQYSFRVALYVESRGTGFILSVESCETAEYAIDDELDMDSSLGHSPTGTSILGLLFFTASESCHASSSSHQEGGFVSSEVVPCAGLILALRMANPTEYPFRNVANFEIPLSESNSMKAYELN